MNLKQSGLVALLSATVTLAGIASTTPASAHMVKKQPYGCLKHPKPKKCNEDSGSALITGGAGANVGGGAVSSGAGSKSVTSGASGSTPLGAVSSPQTGFGGTAQDRGSSPRTAAAGGQAVVVGLASGTTTQQSVSALPATGGGAPSQPQSPLLALFAAFLAALGIGLRKLATRP